MYRGQEPTFCRACGTPWTPGRGECTSCGEPAQARPVGDGFGRKLPAFTPQRRLVRALTVLTVVYAVMLVLELVAGLGERRVLSELTQGHVGHVGLAADELRSWATLAAAVAYLAVIPVFGVWLVRAGRNLRARGILDTRDIEEARILWFFVPVLHLYRPLLGMRELWQGSRAIDPAEWRSERVPVVLWLWWPVWLLSNLAGNLALWAWYEAISVQELLLANELELWREALRLGCVPLFLAVVWGIERAQTRTRRG